MRISDPALRRLGWCLVAVFAVLSLMSWIIDSQDPEQYSDWGAGGVIGDSAFVAMVTLFPLVAQLIIRQQPRNRMGWLLHAIGLSWAVANGADAYVNLAMVVRPGSLPRGDVAEVINAATWIPPIVLMGVFVLLLFPDGRPLSRPWRVLGWVAAADAVVLIVSSILKPGPVEDVRVPLPYNPLGIDGVARVFDVVQAVALMLLPLSVAVAACSVALRYRRADRLGRLQLKWLLAAGAVIAVVSSVAMTSGLGSSGPTPGWQIAVQSLDILSFGLLPLAIGIAVTRHGLYGIDALISRALTVTVLGAFVTAVYIGMVVGVGALVGQRHPSVALSVLATALVAWAFQPVRNRVQHAVNRMVYGERATPYEVLSDFAVRMTGRYTTGELLPRLAQTLSEALGGARVGVWIRTGQGLTRGGAWPADEGVQDLMEPEDDPLAGINADRVVPVRHRDELLGAIGVTKRAHEPFGSAETALLQHVASQAGLMLRNARLVDDLRSSRRRLVRFADVERRRLERDLHDGAQQSLVSVAIMLQLAVAQPDQEALAASITAAAGQLRTAIDELRDLAHGIHPAILTERGLGPAAEALALRSAVPVRVNTDLDRRLPAAIEATLYFAVAEGLANVSKYADATEAEVIIRDEGYRIVVSVRDDGAGGADITKGTGLLGLTDRLAVAGGQLELHSPPGRGTRMTCQVPVPGDREPGRTGPTLLTGAGQA